jgi:hypothetical protein
MRLEVQPSEARTPLARGPTIAFVAGNGPGHERVFCGAMADASGWLV